MSYSKILQSSFYVVYSYLILKRRIPFLASYKLTYRCNLKCFQCPFYLMESKQPSFAEVKSTLEELHHRGSRLVVFEGGEPMLWKDQDFTVHDVIREARKIFLSTGMTTNGILPLDVQTDILWVSIDGLRATHNRLRGADIFDCVMENIRQSKHPKLFSHITINNQNYEEIPDVIELLSKETRGITIQFFYPYNQQAGLFLPFDKREKLLEQIICMKKNGYPILNSVAALHALKRNQWRCLDWLVDNANPDNSITHGCYLKGRADQNCPMCGFSPHTEISLAFQGNWQAIKSGMDIFFR